MNSTPDVGQKADADEVRALLRELSQQLLAWSWEGVVGYEEMVERVGRTYGYADTTVVMEAQLAMIKLEADEHMTFVKGGIPGFPPMAYTQDIKNLLADIYEGKLGVAEARKALEALQGWKSRRKRIIQEIVFQLQVIAIQNSECQIPLAGEKMVEAALLHPRVLTNCRHANVGITARMDQLTSRIEDALLGVNYGVHNGYYS